MVMAVLLLLLLLLMLLLLLRCQEDAVMPLLLLLLLLLHLHDARRWGLQQLQQQHRHFEPQTLHPQQQHPLS